MPLVVRTVGDDVSTDVLYPGRYMATVLPGETPQFAFADDVELNRRLRAGEVPPGSVIVAGRNFGCGSSREQAVSCLKGHELTIVAKGFARIFLSNAVNLGLRVVTAPDVEAAEGHVLEIGDDRVVDVTSGRTFGVAPLPEARRAIVDAGGLIAYTRRRLMVAGAGPGLRPGTDPTGRAPAAG
jgi:3-isopropylmalate/(R)-2-methylmalate dehydratase small subunit